jgi:hypothetical protein
MKEDYKLIPMSEITDEARELAVTWTEGFEEWMKSDIKEKHKLASDIMNYAKKYHTKISVSDNRFEKLLKDVIDWQNKTFGKATPLSKIRHLQKEAEELADEIICSAYEGPENEMIRLEYADNFLLLFGSALSANFTFKDIYDAMCEKLEINKKREWGEPDKDGVQEHIHNKKGSPG